MTDRTGRTGRKRTRGRSSGGGSDKTQTVLVPTEKGIAAAAEHMFHQSMPFIAQAFKHSAIQWQLPRTKLSALCVVEGDNMQTNIVSHEKMLETLEKFNPSLIERFQEASATGFATVVYSFFGKWNVFAIEEDYFEKIEHSQDPVGKS